MGHSESRECPVISIDIIFALLIYLLEIESL